MINDRIRSRFFNVRQSGLKPSSNLQRRYRLKTGRKSRTVSTAISRNFLEISDTSATAILEYLGEGARDPNLDNENGTTRGPFLNQSLCHGIDGHLSA
jgi:hypothetical protein